MKGRASEFGVVVVQSSSTLQMNPPSLTRPKSSASMATIVVDMGNRGEADMLRLKSNGAMDAYSPAKKPSARPEPVSRIHCIPLLMVFVFFILWTASSEILPERNDALPELFVMRMDPSNKLAVSKEQTKDEISKHGTRIVLNHENSNVHATNDGSHSLGYFRSRKRLSVRSTNMRGTAS